MQCAVLGASRLVAMPTIEWDLKTLDADSFKKKFEEEIMKPVEEVIKKSKTTPGVQLPAELHASMLGLTSALAGRLSVAMESATSQMGLDVHNTYGSPESPQLCLCSTTASRASVNLA